MRVGFDVSELAGGPGGVRTAILLLLEALRDHAPDVQVVAMAPRGAPVPRGVRFFPTGGPDQPRAWRRSHALREACERVDLFHSPVLAHPDLAHIPVVVTVHELPFVVHVRLEGFRRALAQWRWLSRAMACCRGIVVPSRATLEQVRLVHPGAVRITTVIPHPAPRVDETQHTHDGSLLFVGRLDRRKSVESLLAGCVDVAGRVRLAGPHDEPRRRQVAETVRRLGLEARVDFVGEVDDATLAYLYRQAGAVALVSLSEGFGFPVLEALGRGVPVIVAPGTGAAEVAGPVGLVADPGRPEEIAAAWRRALETEHRAFVRTQGPARLLAHAPAKAAQAYEELWRRALAG